MVDSAELYLEGERMRIREPGFPISTTDSP